MVAFGIEPKRRALNSSKDEPRDSTLIYSCTCGTSTSIGWRSVNQRLEFYAAITGGLNQFYHLRSVTITSRDPVLGQNGSGQNGTDKMVWTKWYGQNGTDEILRVKSSINLDPIENVIFHQSHFHFDAFSFPLCANNLFVTFGY